MDVESIYREESLRILATLIRLLGDFDLAEDAMQEDEPRDSGVFSGRAGG